MNALVSTTNDRQALAAQAFAGGVNPFLNTTRAEGVTDGVFGRFNGNTGDYIVGDETIEHGTPVAFEFLDAKQQWLGFDEDNKPHRGPEVSLISGQSLPDPEKKPGIRWNKQIVVPIVTMEGQRIVYSSKADKPTRPIWRLIDKFGKLISRQRDEHGKYMVPVVEVGARSFEMTVEEPQMDGSKRKIKVTKYAEDFKIVSWMSEGEIDDIVASGGSENEDDTSARPMKDMGKVIEVEVIEPEPKPVEGARRPRAGQRV